MTNNTLESCAWMRRIISCASDAPYIGLAYILFTSWVYEFKIIQESKIRHSKVCCISTSRESPTPPLTEAKDKQFFLKNRYVSRTPGCINLREVSSKPNLYSYRNFLVGRRGRGFCCHSFEETHYRWLFVSALNQEII